jgi:lysozyme
MRHIGSRGGLTRFLGSASLIATSLLVATTLLIATTVGCATPPAGDGALVATTSLDPRWGEVEGALKVCPAGTTVKGVDVSVYQKSIDWAKVAAAGYVFAIARIGHGTGKDSYFQTNWSGMQANGIVRGAYLFYAPTQDATAQAQNIIDAVGMLSPGDLPVTIDVEWTTGTPNATHLGTVVSLVEAGTGKRPMIYTSVGYWDQYFTTEFGDLDLWVANWGATCPSIPSSWTNWLFWQTSGGGGTVPGIAGGVDENVFNGSLDDLKAAAGMTGQTNCSTTQAMNCGAFGCGCADDACSGGACPGTGCSAQAVTNCGAFGCGCSDGQCSGGACPGSGCTYKETTDCSATGCSCEDHACVCDSGACTAAETAACAGQGCQCSGHLCTQCAPPPGCTTTELDACGAQGCQCADHVCTQCTAGPSCTPGEIASCGASGCGCADHVCSGGQCAGNGCTTAATDACLAQGKSCWLGACKDPTPPGDDVAAGGDDVVEPPADVVDSEVVAPDAGAPLEPDVAATDDGSSTSDTADGAGPIADADEPVSDASTPGAGAEVGASDDVAGAADATGGGFVGGDVLAGDASGEVAIAIGRDRGGCSQHGDGSALGASSWLLVALGAFARRRRAFSARDLSR